MNALRCRQLTFGVFAGTYWGYSENCESEIYKNRVLFFQDFRVRRLWKFGMSAGLWGVKLDHFEAYTAGTGVVLVCSNYGATPDPWMLMAECAPLYGFGATSYIRAFEGVDHAKAFIKAIPALSWAWPANTYEKMKHLCVPFPRGGAKDGLEGGAE